MLSEKLENALNEQITAELWSANLYLSMSFWMKHEGYEGFAHWLRKQAEEETTHAYAFADFIAKRVGIAKIDKVDVVPQEWDAPLQVFEEVLKHEQKVSSLVNELLALATAEKDFATQDFMWQFVREQVEEEATAQAIVSDLKLAGTTGAYFVDSKMGQRQ